MKHSRQAWNHFVLMAYKLSEAFKASMESFCADGLQAW